MTLPLTPEEYRLFLRRDFMSFAERAFYELNPHTLFKPSPHIELMASKLQAVCSGQIKRLTLCVPPRSLKSHLASIVLPAYLSRPFPRAGSGLGLLWSGSLGTTSASLPDPHGKLLLQAHLPYPGARSTSCRRFHDHGVRRPKGYLCGRSVHRSRRQFVDLRRRNKAGRCLFRCETEVDQRMVRFYCDQPTNDQTNDAMVVVMQRLHQDDLVGHLMQMGGWELLSLPADRGSMTRNTLSESPLGRKIFRRREGEVLHPERQPLAILQSSSAEHGPLQLLGPVSAKPHPGRGHDREASFGCNITLLGRGRSNQWIVQSWTPQKSTERSDQSVCTTGASGWPITYSTFSEGAWTFPNQAGGRQLGPCSTQRDPDRGQSSWHAID